MREDKSRELNNQNNSMHNFNAENNRGDDKQ